MVEQGARDPFRDNASGSDPAAPVGGVAARSGDGRRRRQVLVAALAAAVTTGAVAVVGLHRPSAPARTITPAATSSPATVSSVPASSVPASASASAPSTSSPSVPSAALTSADLVPVSGSVAYVFVAVGPVQRLYVTTDAGEHLRAVTAPSATSSTGAGLELEHLVFPTSSVGYALLGDRVTGPTVVETTTDGGGSWRRLEFPPATRVVALEGHGSRVYAVTVRCPSSGRCDGAELWSAVTGAPGFRRVAADLPTRDVSGGVGLAGWDDSVWVMLGVGSTTDPLTLRSRDAGTSFVTRPGPAAVACSARATSAQVLWTSCSTGMSTAFLRTRLDEASSTLPVTGAGTGNTFLDPVSDEVAYFGTAVGDAAGLYRSTDGGRRFNRVSAGPPGYAADGTSALLTFLTPQVGLAVQLGGGLHRSVDGGVTWQPVDLPAAS